MLKHQITNKLQYQNFKNFKLFGPSVGGLFSLFFEIYLLFVFCFLRFYLFACLPARQGSGLSRLGQSNYITIVININMLGSRHFW